MFCYVFDVLYTQSLVLMLQYHIVTTNHSTVPLFIRYIILCSLYFTHNHLYYCNNITYQQLNILPFPCLYGTFFCVRCIVHTITCNTATISHINNQTFYRFCVYTVHHFVFVVLYTQSLVLMLQYHISTTKHSSVPVFIRYITLCSLYCTHNHLYCCYNITYQQPNILPFPCLYATLICVRCIVHTITCTTATISHINNQTFYRSRPYTVHYFVFVVLYTQSLVLMLQYYISTTKHSTVPVFIRYIILCSLHCTHNHLY
jgi:hypothetical protein